MKAQDKAPRMVQQYMGECHICGNPIFAQKYSTSLLRLTTSCICYSKSQAAMTSEQWAKAIEQVGGRPLKPLPTVDQYTLWYALGGPGGWQWG